MSEDVLILRDLTDEEINNLSEEDIMSMMEYYDENGVPYRSTVKSLLEDNDVSTDGLTEFILTLDVGRCNYANRTKKQIYISRHNSSLRDNIVINLDDSRDIPDVVIQIQVTDNFIHEEAYNDDGLLIYQT